MLELYKEYSRKELHGLFSDSTRFVEGGGSWGLSGVVKPKNKIGIYLLFCNIDIENPRAGYQKIKKNGEFQWLSQPSSIPESREFTDLVRSGKEGSKVHLFVRKSSGQRYTYLGTLLYISHDPESYRPVKVLWSIDPWPPAEKLKAAYVQGQ